MRGAEEVEENRADCLPSMSTVTGRNSVCNVMVEL